MTVRDRVIVWAAGMALLAVPNASGAQSGQDEFKLVTPGIRPSGSAAGDQRRVMTPLAAVEAGADYLVIGRPITQSSDPAAVLGAINAELCR